MSEMARSSLGEHRTIALWAVLICIWAGAGSAPAQDTASPPANADRGEPASAEELLRLQDQLRRRSENALADRKQQQSRLDALDGEIRAARRQNDAIARQVEKQKERLAEIDAVAVASGSRAAQISAREEQLKGRIRAFLLGLDERIARGIPWRIEDRRQGVATAIQMLGDSRTGAAAALATLSRLEKEQEAVGRLVESGTLEVETPDGPIAVQGFHLGLLGVIFANDDGSLIGFAAAGESLAEGVEAIRASPGAAKGYQRAVDILNRRRTPELTDLHLPALPTLGDKR